MTQIVAEHCDHAAVRQASDGRTWQLMLHQSVAALSILTHLSQNSPQFRDVKLEIHS